MAFPRSQRSQFGFALGIDIVDVARKAFAKGIEATTGEALLNAHAFVNSLNEYKSGKGGSRSLDSAHKNIAAEAQIAVLKSYDERVDQSHPYRIGDRYSGGALRRALANPEMFVGSYQGIRYMNVAILNREAAHWARLNWGAGPKAASGYPIASAVALSVFGQTLGALVPSDHPQAGFGIPPGIWVGSEVSGRAVKWGSRPAGFYPTASGPMKQTEGIAARRFFDAATGSIAKTLPIEYENLLHAWVDQATRRFNGLGARAAVRGLSIGSRYS